MPIPEYQDIGSLNILAQPDTKTLSRKSVIVTGGASGLGKAYAEAFFAAGAFVTIADYDEVAGKATEAQLSPNAKFVKCDVRSWDDQVAVFEGAIAASPEHSVDVVVANAGIVGADDMFTLDDPSGPPVKPNLRIVEINLMGTIYTTKLALHYFRRQPETAARDRCLIIKGSVAAYADQPGSPQYNISKWGARGLFRNLRRTIWKEGIRVNFVAPWYVRTPILSQKIIAYLESKGVKFATVEDCAHAMIQIAARKEVNGRALGIVPREEVAEGFVDLAHDDYQEGDFMKGWQEIVLATAQSIVDL
ncbi:short chain dehydrogenase reductase [Grosmannia clavigera kw1407]|uniref:Short chain dehydrogenase reductase n=1 Tax=Grosmannia clavigera (strain kw1407 / UAMH 11150) TaxID=655863 RepID=F0X790_GROCL|nr:short chain dehydrogenase reductase [Grosmannia clavigera kw1407]EFX06215.1 short chain dehydrogenase reductase [Grosmannia clavigera kw1407]